MLYILQKQRLYEIYIFFNTVQLFMVSLACEASSFSSARDWIS